MAHFVDINYDVSDRNSINVLNDDCFGSLFAHLSVEDKFRCEIVCRRWQTLIFAGQEKLQFNGSKVGSTKYFSDKWIQERRIKADTLEVVLKKCPFVRSVILNRINCDDSLAIIGENCLHLESLTMIECVNDINKLVEFAEKYGKKLKKLEIDIEPEEDEMQQFKERFTQLLSICKNVEEIWVFPSLERILKDNIEDESFLPKLKNLYYIFVDDKNEDSFLSSVCLRYQRQMAKFCPLTTFTLTRSQVIKRLVDVSMLQNLVKLRLDLDMRISYQNLDFLHRIQLIGKNCSQLKQFSLTFNNEIPYDLKLKKLTLSFELFTKLKVLWLDIPWYIQISGKCDKLINLTLNSYNLNQNFHTKNIDLIFPNLRRLYLKKYQIQLTDEFLEEIFKLKRLNLIELCPSIKSAITGRNVTSITTSFGQLKEVQLILCPPFGLQRDVQIERSKVIDVIKDTIESAKLKETVDFRIIYYESDLNIDSNQLNLPVNLRIKYIDD